MWRPFVVSASVFPVTFCCFFDPTSRNFKVIPQQIQADPTITAAHSPANHPAWPTMCGTRPVCRSISCRPTISSCAYSRISHNRICSPTSMMAASSETPVLQVWRSESMLDQENRLRSSTYCGDCSICTWICQRKRATTTSRRVRRFTCTGTCWGCVYVIRTPSAQPLAAASIASVSGAGDDVLIATLTAVSKRQEGTSWDDRLSTANVTTTIWLNPDGYDGLISNQTSMATANNGAIDDPSATNENLRVAFDYVRVIELGQNNFYNMLGNLILGLTDAAFDRDQTL